MTNKKERITQTELKEWLSYDEETGVFTWLKRPSHRSNIGMIAGSISVRNNKAENIGIQIKRKMYSANRLAWLYVHGIHPDKVVNIDGNRLNNSIINLMNVSKSQAQSRRKVNKNNKIGIKGVRKTKHGTYKAYFSVKKKVILSKNFKTLDLAQKAFNDAHEKYYGVIA